MPQLFTGQSLPSPIDLQTPQGTIRRLFTYQDVAQFRTALRHPASFYATLSEDEKVALEKKLPPCPSDPRQTSGSTIERSIKVRPIKAIVPARPLTEHLSLLYGPESPLSHRALLHHDQSAAVISFDMTATKKRWFVSKGTEDTGRLLEAAGKDDQFIAPNEFRKWRNIDLLETLRALYVDIDNSATRLSDVLALLTKSSLPHPSFILHSGRGMHLYWRHVPAPAVQLPLWQLVENTLVAALIPLGADDVVKDCTRVLRLAGSVNGKAKKVAYLEIVTGVVWTLEELAAQITDGLSDEEDPNDVLDDEEPQFRFRTWNEMAEYRPVKSGVRWNKPAQAKRRRVVTSNIYTRWNLVRQDLLIIANYHGASGIKEARCRDKWLFLYAVALGWFTSPETIKDEMLEVARVYSPSTTGKQALKEVSSAIKRAEKSICHLPGKLEFDQDPRFRFKRSTLYKWLAPLIPESLIPNLRAIIPDAVARERAQVRSKARATGEYTKQGVRRSNVEKMKLAQGLAGHGHGVRSISRQLSVSHKTIQKWLANPLAK